MSETVHYKGTLILLERLENETLEEQIQRILCKDELPSYAESWEECLYSDYYKEYTVSNNILYKVEEIKSIGDYDIFDIHKNTDGTYDFEVMYYNGGCSFDEAIEEAFKNLIK